LTPIYFLYYTYKMLEKKFRTLCAHFSNEYELIDNLWKKINTAYGEKHRKYHSLEHIEHIYNEMKKLSLKNQEQIVVEFTIYYHDIIYDIHSNENEQQSANYAKKALNQLNVSNEISKKVVELIQLTKTHSPNQYNYYSLFLDADLAILGSSEKTYQNYIEKIRQEYNVYNDEIYNNGRKKVLNFFLKKESIYKSSYFYKKYEKQAQHNLLIEYNSLTNNT